ncbi:hypothetical protein CROQUDRAFT_99082 [Cronartium quercuum f. sp. fusiforme G11]|uniref:Uncharacterized protein n=1 Tax=Cronartium quercuum f. sp. fusiforme G11 TaxID=708437 RepID=A0A9P6NCD5_9BASI|nr:hypothetical protein CROQUDRAFT_99082 [Cronartium quercuum f. sp. fusiforme G11]
MDSKFNDQDQFHAGPQVIKLFEDMHFQKAFGWNVKALNAFEVEVKLGCTTSAPHRGPRKLAAHFQE